MVLFNDYRGVTALHIPANTVNCTDTMTQTQTRTQTHPHTHSTQPTDTPGRHTAAIWTAWTA